MENIRQNPFLHLDEELNKLQRLSWNLRFISLLTLFATLVNLAVALFLWSGYATDGKLSTTLRPIPLLAGLSAILGAGLYDYFRRQGNILYDEISDEMEWHVRRARLSEGEALAEQRPDVKLRLIMRMFSHANDLPLIHGKTGPMVYVLLNLSLAAIAYLAR